MIDQINSLFNSQFSKLQKSKSLELGIVVKRVVLALLLFCFCFVDVHLLFSNDIVHLHTLVKACDDVADPDFDTYDGDQSSTISGETIFCVFCLG